MLKWIIRIILVGVVGCTGYGFWDTYQRGYFNLPEMPDGAYAFSVKGVLRGIVLDADVPEGSDGSRPKFLRRLAFENPSRRYSAVSFQKEPWMLKAWSTCTKPTDEETEYVFERLPEDMIMKYQYSRLEAVCTLKVDDKVVPRGVLFSTPRL